MLSVLKAHSYLLLVALRRDSEYARLGWFTAPVIIAPQIRQFYPLCAAQSPIRANSVRLVAADDGPDTASPTGCAPRESVVQRWEFSRVRPGSGNRIARSSHRSLTVGNLRSRYCETLN